MQLGHEHALGPINLWGSRVALGPLTRELIPYYVQWVNDFANMYTYGVPVPVTLEQASELFDATVGSSTVYRFAIYDRVSMKPIGYTSLVDVDFRNRRGEFEIMIGDRSFQGKGYGTEVTLAMLDYAFSRLGLHNVLLEVSSHNEAGIRAYERAGFQEIGRRREAFLMNGQWHDKIYMDVLSSEFMPPSFDNIQPEV